jgi:recombination protein RecT
MSSTNDVAKALAKTEDVKKGNTLAGLLERVDVKKRFSDMMGNRAAGFMSSIISCANNSQRLKVADPMTIISAAAMAATLDLPINPALGFAHIVPYENKKEGTVKAQFQMGWKGFVQLAQRSRQYQTINADVVYEGELKTHNKLTGEITYSEEDRKSDRVIGYFAYFRLINGFEKALFMKTEDVEKHGKRYSKSFAYPGSVWKTNFDAMALKTVVKLLISKWGPMSVDMQRAITADQGTVINDGGKEGVPEVQFDDAVVVDQVAEMPKVDTSAILDEEAGTAQEPE